MTFLSLGLLKDEREDVVREDAAAKGKELVRELSSSSRDGSGANRPASISKGSNNGTAGSWGLRSFDPVAPQNGASPSTGSGQALKGARPTQEAVSHLPLAIEEL